MPTYTLAHVQMASTHAVITYYSFAWALSRACSVSHYFSLPPNSPRARSCLFLANSFGLFAQSCSSYQSSRMIYVLDILRSKPTDATIEDFQGINKSRLANLAPIVSHDLKCVWARGGPCALARSLFWPWSNPLHDAFSTTLIFTFTLPAPPVGCNPTSCLLYALSPPPGLNLCISIATHRSIVRTLHPHPHPPFP